MGTGLKGRGIPIKPLEDLLSLVIEFGTYCQEMNSILNLIWIITNSATSVIAGFIGVPLEYPVSIPSGKVPTVKIHRKLRNRLMFKCI